MKLVQAITVIGLCLLVAEARRGGGGSRGGSRGSSSGGRSRPGSSSSSRDTSRDRSDSKPYPVQPKPPSYPSAPSAPSAPGHTWNTGGAGAPPAPGWNLGGQPKNPGTNGLLNPPTNPHWNPSAGSGGFPQNKPPAPGWNVGNNNPSPGLGTNTFQQHGSQPGWNTGGYGSRPAGGYGGYGNSYGAGGYGHQQSFPTYGNAPPGWNNPAGNFNFGNRMGGFGGPGYGTGTSLSKGSSKAGLLAAAGAGAATVAGVYFLSQAMSPSRGYGSNYYPGGNYHNGYHGNHNGPISGSGGSNGPNNQPPMPQMLCVGGSNNCTYTPIAVQCVNATFNGSDGTMQWQIACGDPKMSPDLCFSKVNLTCTNATVLSMNGTTSNVTTQVCKLEYAIDHIRDSNCTASLTFPEQYVSNSASKSGSSGKYWALLIIPIGLAIVGGICWMTGCGKNSSGGKGTTGRSHSMDEPHFSPEVNASLYQSNQPYPMAGASYQSQAPPYPSGPTAPYPTDMPMYPTGPSAPYPTAANVPPYAQSNFSGYPTGPQPPYPSAPY